jgi:porin
MSLSVCPSPRSLSLESGFTIFPSSNWGSRIRLQPVTAAYVQLGVYQRRPEGGGRAGLDWSTSDTTGAILPMELGFEPNFGQQHLIGHYKLGAIYDTSDHADLGDGQLVPTTRSRHGDPSLYILLDQMIMRTGPNGTDGVILLAGYTHADAHVAQVEQLAFAGVLASGIIPARPADSIGFQFTWLKVSNALISTQELQADFGEPLSPGLSTLATPPGIQGHEANLEARYDIHLASGIHLMPDIQYVIHPDATSRYHNATILGLRTTLEFY